MNFGSFFVEVAKLLLPLIGLLISFLVAFGAEYLRQRAKNQVVARAIEAVEGIVKGAVLEAQQTIVEDLKAANGGKLTEGDKRRIKENVLKAIKSRLTQDTIKELQGITQDLEAYLIGLLESYVYMNKEMREIVSGN